MWRWILWIAEREPPMSTEAPPRTVTITEVDEQLTHLAVKLPLCTDKQRLQWMNVVDQWLDVRNRVTLTNQLEHDLNEPQP